MKRSCVVLMSGLMLGSFAGQAVAEEGTCFETPLYKSYPLIVESGITDIREGNLCCNGPLGFAFFDAAVGEKSGNLPASLGGLSGWDTDVWASNFQGPYRQTGHERIQWEWAANGALEVANRTYPAVYCQQVTSSPSSFNVGVYKIEEHDDFPGDSNDYIGKVQIDHRYCKTEVFDTGSTSGWTNFHTTPGIDRVYSTTYKLYCSMDYHCSAQVICANGRILTCEGAGHCSDACSAGEDWIQCGSMYKDCYEEPTACPDRQIICDPV
jgi:hypothetical protein